MAFSHILTKTLTVNGRAISLSTTVEGDGRVVVEAAIPATEGPHTVDIQIDFSQILCVFIAAANPLTLDFWPVVADTLDLKGGVPFIWHANEENDNPITDDVTSIEVTNLGTFPATTLYIEVLYDAVPPP